MFYLFSDALSAANTLTNFCASGVIVSYAFKQLYDLTTCSYTLCRGVDAQSQS